MSALCKTRQSPETVIVEPKATNHAHRPGSSESLTWAACPFSKGRATKLSSYKSSPDEYILENLQPQAIQSGLSRLKVPYGAIKRRPREWLLKH